ncbi:MAG: hypothetical protein D6B25_06135 [Desulfobulbaceae bacterium]|nr:MAG: hypothetical protein D6B25_06135 [Desulfobulbaceae bacterium]
MNLPGEIPLKLLSSEPTERFETERLAQQYRLSISTSFPRKSDIFLRFINDVLTLVVQGLQDKVATKISIDFLSGHSGYRLQNDLRIGTPFAKAIGIKKGVRPTVCDTTAGFGQDGFHLAALGCQVTMIERSHVIHLLLEDGIRRGSRNPKFGKIFKQRITLKHGDAIELIPKLSKFQTLYLDPMYPPRKGSALSKKNLYLLRHIVGNDLDSTQLFHVAQRVDPARIVVKRPGKIAGIGSVPPSFEVAGKHIRYDVYLPPYL